MIELSIDELFDLGECDDLIKSRIDFRLGHAEQSAVEINVLPPRQIRMETGTDLEQRSDAPSNGRPASTRTHNSGQDLEQSALSRSIATNNAEDLPCLN